MAFSFGNNAFGAAQPNTGMGGQMQAGPDLPDIQTEVG